MMISKMPGIVQKLWAILMLVVFGIVVSLQAVVADSHKDVSVLKLGGWRTHDIIQMNRFLDIFHEQQPHIRILYDPTSAPEYDTVLATQLFWGTAPDLFYLRSFSISRNLFAQGYIAPLDDLAGLQKRFEPHYLRPWQSGEGTVFGVPFIATAHGIYYNKDIFQRLELETPRTWAELLTVARAIQDDGLIPFANASGDSWTINEIVFMNILPGFIGGSAGRKAYLSGERCFNDQSMVEAFQALADLAPFLPENHRVLKYEDSLELFLQRQAVMWFGGSWDIAFFDEQQPVFQWGVFAPPPHDQPPAMVFHPDAGIGLNAATDQKQAALVFLSWLTDPETGKLLGDMMPGFFSMHSERQELSNLQAQDFLELVLERDDDIRFVWDGLRDGNPDGYTLLLKLALDVLEGVIPAREAADALQAGLAAWYIPAQQCATH